MKPVEIISIISMSVGIITVLGRVLIVWPLKSLIREQTYPLQPYANGGKSLPDIAKAAQDIKVSIDSLSHQIDRVEGRLDTHIEQHMEGRI